MQGRELMVVTAVAGRQVASVIAGGEPQAGSQRVTGIVVEVVVVVEK